jgi:hypothetical protein
MNKLIALGLSLSIIVALFGCLSAKVNRHPPVIQAIPLMAINGTNTYAYIKMDGGWDASYWKFGMDTECDTLDIAVASNGYLVVRLDGWRQRMSSNNVAMVSTSLSGLGVIAGQVVSALASSGISSFSLTTEEMAEALKDKAAAKRAKEEAALAALATNTVSTAK